MLTLFNRIHRLEKQFNVAKRQHVRRLPDHTIEFLNDVGGVYQTYIPTPTAKSFHESRAFVRNAMGPFGSGKTTFNLMDMLHQACDMPKCIDGIRRIKFAIIRNTAGELETSTYASWLNWFGDLGDITRRKKPILHMEHRFDDGDGPIEMIAQFIACDREESLKKFKSTEYTAVYINEACELPEALLLLMKGRVGHRYPSTHICPEDYFTGIMMDTNPPSLSHWLYRLFEIDKPDEHELFRQPPGLLKNEDNQWIANPLAENIGSVGVNYYVNQALGATDEFIRVFCCGEYGVLKAGKPVYPMYNDDIHSTDDLQVDLNYPIYLGWDFGLTPACSVVQYIDGQARFIKEFTSDNCMLEDLISYAVKPWLNVHAPNLVYYSDCDPGDSALLHHKDTLQAHGIHTNYASTNKLEPRIDSVKKLLSGLAMGKPTFIISRNGCPVARSGFIRDYFYKKVNILGDEKYKEEPYKSHPVSDIHDALQYVALRIKENVAAPVNIDTSQFMDRGSYI